MLSALKTIIDLLEKGLKIGFGVAKARRRRETLMALMTAYLVMRRIALTGHQLLELAGDMLWSREKGHKVKLPEHIFRSRSD